MRRTLYSLAILAVLAAPAAALTPDQLTSDEQTAYQKVKGDPTSAQNFLATRDFVRKARAVVSGSSRATEMPRKPSGFDERYLLPGDSDAIDQAVIKGVSALAGSLFA